MIEQLYRAYRHRWIPYQPGDYILQIPATEGYLGQHINHDARTEAPHSYYATLAFSMLPFQYGGVGYSVDQVVELALSDFDEHFNYRRSMPAPFENEAHFRAEVLRGMFIELQLFLAHPLTLTSFVVDQRSFYRELSEVNFKLLSSIMMAEGDSIEAGAESRKISLKVKKEVFQLFDEGRYQFEPVRTLSLLGWGQLRIQTYVVRKRCEYSLMIEI